MSTHNTWRFITGDRFSKREIPCCIHGEFMNMNENVIIFHEENDKSKLGICECCKSRRLCQMKLCKDCGIKKMNE